MLEIIGGFIAVGVGLALGIAAGAYLLPEYFQSINLKRFDIAADYDVNIPMPERDPGVPVPYRYRKFVDYFPDWAKMPDFNRVLWMNHVMRTLWPYANQAIGKTVLESVKPQLDELCKTTPFLESLDIEVIDFGTRPTIVAGVKVYDSTADELIMECPMQWGSNARVRVAARLGFGKYVLYIPAEIADLQIKARTRITLDPLVDVLPCMGAVTVSLLESPYLDCSLRLFGNLDLMMLPVIKDAARFALARVLGDMVVYPNKMTFDIMEGRGVPPDPVGMLQIKVLKIENITAGGDTFSKVDPYLEMGVRDGRHQRTRTVKNNKNPTYDEVFNIVVDDLETQTLSLTLRDDDLGVNDKAIGTAELELEGQEFARKPRSTCPVTIELIHPPAAKRMARYAKLDKDEKAAKAKQADKAQNANGAKDGASKDGAPKKINKIPDAAPTKATQDLKKMEKAIIGRCKLEVKYVPFHAPKRQPDHGAGGEPPNTAQRDAASANLAKVVSSDKGILTVTLVSCSNLQAPDGQVDPFVEMTLIDPEREKPEMQVSPHMDNEPDPHWNLKFDFVLVSATSTIHFDVYDKKGMLQEIFSLKTITGHRREKEKIGSLRLKVKEVVKNRRILDTWALQETQKGDISLKLDWLPIRLQADTGLAQPGIQGDLTEKEQKKVDDEKQSQPDGGPKPHKPHKSDKKEK